MKFKIGDKVKIMQLLESCDQAEIGDIGVVANIDDDIMPVKVDINDIPSVEFYESELELVKEEKDCGIKKEGIELVKDNNPEEKELQSMRFLNRDCNSVTITSEKEQIDYVINTLKHYTEDSTKVVLSCAEYIPFFTRGFTCDLSFVIGVIDYNHNEYNPICEKAENLVLVYINKNMDDTNGSMWEYEYIFYK